MDEKDINRIDPEQTPVENPAPAQNTAPVQEPAPAAKAGIGEKLKALVKKPVAIVVAAVVVVAVVVGVIASAAGSSNPLGVSSGPLGLVGTGLQNSIEALEKNDVVEFVTDVLDGGSVELYADLETLTEFMMGYGLEGFASVKLYTSDSEIAATANVEIEDEELLDLILVANEKEIAVSSETLLDGDAYGINLKKLVDNFEDSVFGPDGDYYIGIDSLEDMSANTAEMESAIKDLEKIGKEAVAKLFKSINKHAEIEKENDTIKFNGEEVKVTAVEVTVDGEALGAIAVDMIEYLQKDKGIKNFLYDNAELILYITGDYYYMDAEDMEEMLDDFYEELDDMDKEDLEELAEMMADSDVEFTVTFYVTKSGKELVGIKVAADSGYDTVKVTVTAGPSLAELSEISVSYTDSWDNYRVTYTVDTNDKKEYSAELKVREDTEIIVTGSLDWDKKDGDCKLTVTDYWGDTVVAKGSIEKSGKKTTITLDSVADSYDEYDLGISLILSTSDKMPNISKYTDILTMDSDELEDLLYDMEEVIYDLEYFLYMF